MSVLFDRVSRSYFCLVTPGNGVTVREHRAPQPSEQVAVKRQRMRAGARELLNILSEAQPRRLKFIDLLNSLQDVSVDTLQVRLSALTARGDIVRHGMKFNYSYSLPTESTFHTTTP
jgi:hypothetical protein